MRQWLALGVFLLTSLPFWANEPVAVRGSYNPSEWAVLYVRGLNSNEVPIPTISSAFPNEFPDIPVVVAKIGDGSPEATRRGMYHLIEDVFNDAKSNPILAGKRVIVVGASQGGLVARAFIEKYAHQVPFVIDSFLSLASPQAGEFGLPDGWESYVDMIVWHGDALLLQQIAQFLGISGAVLSVAGSGEMTVEMALGILRDTPAVRGDILDPIRTAIADLIKSLVRSNFPLVRIVFYNLIGQDLVSVAGYWKDPEHKDEYLAFNSFLPYFNNEKNHDQAQQYRENLQRLNYIVFLWAGRDNVVKPDCSGGLCFYKWGSRTQVDRAFTDTEQYRLNLLGLKYMYDNGHMFIENPPGMGHGCDGPGIEVAMHYIRNIITRPALNVLADAVKANNLPLVQSLVEQDQTSLFKRDGFNQLPIYYAGNKLDIAQYLFNSAYTQGKPLPIDEQKKLLINAAGSGSLAVAQWLIETIHFAIDEVRAEAVAVARENKQTALVDYLSAVSVYTLHQAVAQNNLAAAVAMMHDNPTLVAQMVSGMLPIYYAGNKLELAQALFDVHLRYVPMTLAQLYQLLYFAFGSGSLPVAQWIIEGLYFDPTTYQQALISIANTNGQIHMTSYLNGIIAQNRPTMHAAVRDNNLAKIMEIVGFNAANSEQFDGSGMLPIFYAGNKIEIARYLYGIHSLLGRPLTEEQLNTLLYFAFGSGSLAVAQWLLEEVKMFPLSPSALAVVAQTNGQVQMINYLRSLGYAV